MHGILRWCDVCTGSLLSSEALDAPRPLSADPSVLSARTLPSTISYRAAQTMKALTQPVRRLFEMRRICKYVFSRNVRHLIPLISAFFISQK